MRQSPILIHRKILKMTTPVLRLLGLLNSDQQNNIRESFASEFESTFENYGHVDGLREMCKLSDPDKRLPELKTRLFNIWTDLVFGTLLPSFCPEVMKDGLPPDGEPITREMVFSSSDAWCKKTLYSKVLPTECSISGSYPDHLYYLQIGLSCVYERKWYDEEEDDADDEGEERGNAGASGCDDTRSAIISSMTQASASNWQWNGTAALRVKALFYKMLAKRLKEDSEQFTWDLSYAVTKAAIMKWNETQPAKLCPCDDTFLLTQANPKARYVWLAAKSFKQLPAGDEEPAEVEHSVVPQKVWEMYYRKIVKRGMNSAVGTSKVRSPRAAVVSAQQSPMQQALISRMQSPVGGQPPSHSEHDESLKRAADAMAQLGPSKLDSCLFFCERVNTHTTTHYF